MTSKMIPGGGLTRRQRGKQIPVTLYVPVHDYWLLKSLCKETGHTMQFVLKRGLGEALRELQETVTRRPMRRT